MKILTSDIFSSDQGESANMEERQCEDFGAWVCIVVACFVLIPLLLLNINYMHAKKIKSSSEPPVLKLSDYPKTEEHCRICPQCRERWDLIEKNQIAWESPVCCKEGFEIGMLEFREKLEGSK